MVNSHKDAPAKAGRFAGVLSRVCCMTGCRSFQRQPVSKTNPHWGGCTAYFHGMRLETGMHGDTGGKVDQFCTCGNTETLSLRLIIFVITAKAVTIKMIRSKFPCRASGQEAGIQELRERERPDSPGRAWVVGTFSLCSFDSIAEFKEIVTNAKAEVHKTCHNWIPAFVGMTYFPKAGLP